MDHHFRDLILRRFFRRFFLRVFRRFFLRLFLRVLLRFFLRVFRPPNFTDLETSPSLLGQRIVEDTL